MALAHALDFKPLRPLAQAAQRGREIGPGVCKTTNHDGCAEELPPTWRSK